MVNQTKRNILVDQFKMSLFRTLRQANILAINDITSKIVQTRTFKSDLKIKFVRPEKILGYKPQKTGDLRGMPEMDLSAPQLEFRNSKELETADETIKKLFSLEFAPRRKTAQAYFKEIKESVQRHPYDVGSIELKIARWTGVIRAFQEVMERFPRNKVTKVSLLHLIDKRKKNLKHLRMRDYKRFEWLLEALDIVYKPAPGYHRVERKSSMRKLTDNYCEGIKQERLDAFKQLLKTEQPAFLEEKIRSLEFIRNEQIQCGVEVTVSLEEIDAVKKQLQEFKECDEKDKHL